MYMTGSYSRVFAVDARTGKKLWQYDARLPDDIRPCWRRDQPRRRAVW